MEDIELLLDRFLDFKNNGRNKYFDADDIVSLIDYFTETDDIENLQFAIDLGYELHPDNTDFKLQICKTLVSLGDCETAIKMIEEIDTEGNSEIDLLHIECLCELGLKEDVINFIAQLAEKERPYLEEAIEHTACVLNEIDEYVHFAHQFISNYLKVYPDNKILKTELCFNLELQGRIKEAMMKCDEFLQSDIYSAELWFMKGRLYATCCNCKKAVEAFDYALSCMNFENEEMKYEILMQKANCFRKNENYYSAISVYEEIMTMDDIDTMEAASYYAECLIMVEDYEQAYHVLKDRLTDTDLEYSVGNIGSFIFCCVMTDRQNEAYEAFCDALLSLPRDITAKCLASIIALQSNVNDVEENGDEDCQELVRDFINSNLHVN
jgi:tetratricopeptide (TPR) repeat protein